ncbi:S53 family peptidase [Polycladomyces subterraneus]|uniref:S53 family peptidase n=1 Tax=Polycladomyces subterraneus TaxID=1016997 RepID=A0ABT8IQR8_9BACL|nr:S53 family peptidase [Polycladomyces subterraneus]MDN4595149.1 S53 family peptidase [Polycladomyces subterraneus]
MRRSKHLFSSAFMATTLLISTFAVGFVPSVHAQPLQWTAHPPIHFKKNATPTYQSGYQPSQIKKAYGIDRLTATGMGQTIAIVDAYGSPTIQNDLATFDAQFGLPAANLQIAYPSGKPNRTDGGWALETAMDVEWAHALAPNAKILLVVAKSASISDLVTAIDYASNNGAQVVSNSWGGAEFSSESSYDSHFQHPGTIYLASSGDSGAGTGWPAVSPFVLAVGGTSLQIDTSGNYLSESGWSGSGGGTSTYVARPSYQDGWSNIVGTQRGNPDISFDADPYTGVAVYSGTKYQGQSGWFVVGGTSLGSPCWAAMLALVDQGRTMPLSSLDTIQQLYQIAGTTNSSGYTNNYHDVTQGSNGGFTSISGYDLVTGIGSPKADALIPALTQAP